MRRRNNKFSLGRWIRVSRQGPIIWTDQEMATLVHSVVLITRRDACAVSSACEALKKEDRYYARMGTPDSIRARYYEALHSPVGSAAKNEVCGLTPEQASEMLTAIRSAT